VGWEEGEGYNRRSEDKCYNASVVGQGGCSVHRVDAAFTEHNGE